MENLVQKENKFSMIYFSIFCEHKNDCPYCMTDDEPIAAPPPKNAFQLMMHAARSQPSNLPTVINDPSNKKENLWNDLLNYISKSCVFPKTDGPVCKTYLTRLRDTLWYIDGHHKTMERESNRKLPDFFSKFTGYNCPENSKHRKRTISNLSVKMLSTLALSLKDVLHCMKFIDDYKAWCDIRLATLKLAHTMEDYATFLEAKNASVKRIQLTPRSEVEKRCNVTVLPTTTKESLYYDLVQADLSLEVSDYYQAISLRENLRPGIDRKRLYQIVDGYVLKKGFTTKSVHYVHHIGGPKASMHFLWKIPSNETETNLIKHNLTLINDIDKAIPIYERRITKREFKNSFGYAAPSHTLRAIFSNLTGDKSSAANLTEAEIDRRLEFCLMSEDQNIIVDLRNQPQEGKPGKYETFFKAVEKYLQDDIGVACHERRHNQELYVAKAISFPDLHARVKEKVADDVEIPSVKWLRFQFQPLNPNANTAKYYKGCIKIKMMVQKRQVYLFFTLSGLVHQPLLCAK